MAGVSAYSQGDEKTELRFYFDSYVRVEKDDPSEPSSVVQLSWDEIFFGIGLKFMSVARDYNLREALSPVIFGMFSGTPAFAEKTRHRSDKE